MRSLIFVLISSIFLLLSCKNESVKQDEENDGVKKHENESTNVIDDLPAAEWNGEYMKIDVDEEPKIKRKSQGSDFYSMGRVDFKIGKNIVDFKLFERKKNALTFTNNSVNAIIKSAFQEDLHVHFRKENILHNYKGKYKVDPTGKSNKSFRMEVVAGEKNQQKKYILESGEAEFIAFSPRLGTFEIKIDGTFSLEDGSEQKGEGSINMRFEDAVMTIDK